MCIVCICIYFTVEFTDQFTNHFTVHFTVQFTVQFTVHFTVQFTVQFTVHFTDQFTVHVSDVKLNVTMSVHSVIVVFVPKGQQHSALSHCTVSLRTHSAVCR